MIYLLMTKIVIKKILNFRNKKNIKRTKTIIWETWISNKLEGFGRTKRLSNIIGFVYGISFFNTRKTNTFRNKKFKERQLKFEEILNTYTSEFSNIKTIQ